MNVTDRANEAIEEMRERADENKHSDLCVTLEGELYRWATALEEFRDIALKQDAKLTNAAKEINRRRGEMAGIREYLTELGVPSERNGLVLSILQRMDILARDYQPPRTATQGEDQ